ncbi:MAG: hypothetical protein GY938_32875, partial [Ketobacter sp.]|nr:hypothetical protein [Ketobacter sp.]
GGLLDDVGDDPVHGGVPAMFPALDEGVPGAVLGEGVSVDLHIAGETSGV